MKTKTVHMIWLVLKASQCDIFYNARVEIFKYLVSTGYFLKQQNISFKTFSFVVWVIDLLDYKEDYFQMVWDQNKSVLKVLTWNTLTDYSKFGGTVRLFIFLRF